MWYKFLQDNYASRDEWLAYSDTYGLAARLGFDSAEAAWDSNPFIQGSTNPADFGRVDASGFADGEVIGMDNDERLILWDGPVATPYNCGETLDEYGVDNLTEVERKRLGIL